MIGLLIISHYGLAQEFKIALEHICGQQQQFQTLSILPEDTIETRLPDLLGAVRQVDDGTGVLILTDIFGATPSNIALSVLDYDVNVEIIAGLNLPMLVKLACDRNNSALDELVSCAKTTGQNNIFSGKDLVCRYRPRVKASS